LFCSVVILSVLQGDVGITTSRWSGCWSISGTWFTISQEGERVLKAISDTPVSRRRSFSEPA
jgi:hypothetical protein